MPILIGFLDIFFLRESNSFRGIIYKNDRSCSVSAVRLCSRLCSVSVTNLAQHVRLCNIFDSSLLTLSDSTNSIYNLSFCNQKLVANPAQNLSLQIWLSGSVTWLVIYLTRACAVQFRTRWNWKDCATVYTITLQWVLE